MNHPIAKLEERGVEKHDVETTTGRLPASSTRQNLRALVMQISAPAPGAPSLWDSALGAIEDSISQCTFLQMTYTAENPCLFVQGDRVNYKAPCGARFTRAQPTGAR